MRSQFIKVLQNICRRRSRESSEIQWWFSDRSASPYRVGAAFNEELTLPFGREPEVETLEDPPLDDEFFYQIGVG